MLGGRGFLLSLELAFSFGGIVPFAYSTPPSPFPSAFFYHSNGIPPLSNRSVGIHGCFRTAFINAVINAVINGEKSLRYKRWFRVRVDKPRGHNAAILNRVSINANRCDNTGEPCALRVHVIRRIGKIK